MAKTVLTTHNHNELMVSFNKIFDIIIGLVSKTVLWNSPTSNSKVFK